MYLSETILCVWSDQSHKTCKEFSTVEMNCKKDLKLLSEIIMANSEEKKIVSREHGWYGNYLLAKCCWANNSTSLGSSVNDILWKFWQSYVVCKMYIELKVRIHKNKY